MLKFILVLFTVIPTLVIGQISEEDQMKNAFWNSNIGAIVAMKKDSILLQTNFPLDVNYVGKKEKWTKEQFREQLPILFDATVRDQLSKDSYTSIDAWNYEDDSSPTYMVVVYPENEAFNSVVLSFIQFNGTWKLYRIDMHLE